MIRTPNDKIYNRKQKTITILCCNGEKVLIDWEDEGLINGKRIWVDGGYAKLKIDGKTFRLHHLILIPRDGLVVDHINRNPLDNRKSNLRRCTLADNSQNRKIHKNNTLGYHGLSFNKKSRKYIVRIIRFRTTYYVGSFDRKDEAIAAYKSKAAEF